MTSLHDPALDAAGAALVARLGGAWRRGHGMCLCPAHDDHSPSLSVRVGARTLLFKCFAGCDTRDVLGAIRALRCTVPRRQADEPSVLWPRPDVRRHLATRLWAAAVPIEQGLADLYLRSRGIVARPEALRFHPRTPVKTDRDVAFRPAIIAAIRQGDQLVAIQRMFLHAYRPALATDLPSSRLTLSRPLQGAVQLRKPERILGLAEGVETALSAIALLGIPVWAALGAERLHQILIPTSVRHLVILPDADRAGRWAAHRALGAYSRPGLFVETCWPWGGLNDWSHVLQDSRAREGRGEGIESERRPDGRARAAQET